MSRTQRAFTLIELLVVIAIISILAAILFPVFSQAKAAAKQTACLSDMKQVGLAMRLYLGDSDDMWFPAVSPSDLGPDYAPQQPWFAYDNNNGPLQTGFYGLVGQPATHPLHPGAIDVYLRSGAITRCPSMPSTWQSALALNWFNPTYSSPYYTTNPAAKGNEWAPAARTLTYLPSGAAVNTGAADTEIDQTSNTIVMWEHQARAPQCNFLQQYDWEQSPPNVQMLRDHFHFLHNSGSNTLWADGHPKRMTYGQLKRPMFSGRKDIYPQ